MSDECSVRQLQDARFASLRRGVADDLANQFVTARAICENGQTVTGFLQKTAKGFVLVIIAIMANERDLAHIGIHPAKRP